MDPAPHVNKVNNSFEADPFVRSVVLKFFGDVVSRGETKGAVIGSPQPGFQAKDRGQDQALVDGAIVRSEASNTRNSRWYWLEGITTGRLCGDSRYVRQLALRELRAA